MRKYFEVPTLQAVADLVGQNERSGDEDQVGGAVALPVGERGPDACVCGSEGWSTTHEQAHSSHFFEAALFAMN